MQQIPLPHNTPIDNNKLLAKQSGKETKNSQSCDQGCPAPFQTPPGCINFAHIDIAQMDSDVKTAAFRGACADRGAAEAAAGAAKCRRENSSGVRQPGLECGRSWL